MRNLKNSKLSRCVFILLFIFATQLIIPANLFANDSKYSKDDPYFQVRLGKMTELTEEEFESLDKGADSDSDSVNNEKIERPIITNKDFSSPTVPVLPTVPTAPGIGGIYPGTGGIFPGTGGGIFPGTGGGLFPGTGAGYPGSIGGAAEKAFMIVDRLIAIGEKIIPMIKAGQPVVTNNPMAAVSVLPLNDVKDFGVHSMGGWSLPRSKHYKITFENGFGSEVVSFVYSVSFQYNGSFNGKGKYLTGIRASAKKINVSWGFDLDASSQLIQISNIGTEEDVVAGATLEMNYTVKNFAKNMTTSESFFVTGAGDLYKLDE